MSESRWEKVYASVRLLNEDDCLPSSLLRRIWQFRIEVVIDGMLWYQVQRVFDEDLEVPGTYGWLLDKMVQQLELAIERGPDEPRQER